MMKKRKYLPIAAIAAVALVAAACSSSDPVATTDPDPGEEMGPTPEDIAEDIAEAKAATDKALAIAMALSETSTTVATGTNGVPTTAAATRSTEAAGGEIEITVSSTENTGLTPAYAMSEDMSPPAIADWHGETHMRSPEDEPVEIVNIYTNIKMAEGNKLVYEIANVPAPGTAPNVIVLADNMKESYASNVDDAEMDAETVMGSVNGIPGAFTCKAGNCEVTFVQTPPPGVDAKTVAGFTGDWAFESTNDVESQAAQKDDYVYFGYWLRANEEDNEFAFATFAGGGDEFATGETALALTELEGSATYNGVAGGKYVEKELGLVEGQAKPVSASGGYFTATATLTATFGGGAIPMDDHDKITGVINNFKDGTTGDDLDFTVNLSARIDGEGLAAAAEDLLGPMVNAAHGNLPNTSGDWTATFFGPAAVDDTTTDVNEEFTTLPTGVAGDFEAHFADGHVAGGYAATR